MINGNTDLINDEIETGLAGDDLRVAFTLDSKVFTTATSADGVNYAAPEIEYVDFAGGTNAALCTFTEGDYEITTPLSDPYPSCAAAVTMYLDSDFTSTLRDCGFLLISDTVADSNGDTFSQYEGQVRVRTEERGDTIRGVVTKKLIEVGFNIIVQFPNNITLSSDVVQAIGTVVEDAALTHQVWNLAERELDVNMFTSVQYPYELVATDFALEFDSLGSNPPVSLAGYPIGLPDSDNSGSSSFLDYFGAPDANTPADGTVDFGTVQFLPPTQCVNVSSNSVNADACNQNFHLRMTPSVSWCDVDFDLVLTLKVVCRTTFDMECDTDNLPPGSDTVTIRFKMDSDNYCPRVVEVADITGQIGLYEDDQWGAHTGTGGPTGTTGTEDERQYPGWYPDAPRNPTGTNTGDRWTQGAFVFGTTLHVETRVTAEAGTNIASSTVAAVHLSSGDTTDIDAADGSWQRLVYEHDPNAVPIAGLLSSVLPCDDWQGEAASIVCPVTVSDDVQENDMSSLITGLTNTGSLSPDGTGSFAARLGTAWEGVSRLTVGVSTNTINLPAGNEGIEPVKVWVTLIITYRAAGSQQELSVRRTTVSSSHPVLNRMVHGRHLIGAAAGDRHAAHAMEAIGQPEHPPTAPALAGEVLPASCGVSKGESSTSTPITTTDGTDPTDEDDTPIKGSALIAGAAGFCLLLLVVVVVSMSRRRRKKNDKVLRGKQGAYAVGVAQSPGSQPETGLTSVALAPVVEMGDLM
jgi:hypothetical protein